MIHDYGYEDEFRGWYDVRGCGTCQDYCRWVGYSGSGGDPSVHAVYGNSYWACQTPESDLAINFKKKGFFQFVKCTIFSNGAWQWPDDSAEKGMLYDSIGVITFIILKNRKY